MMTRVTNFGRKRTFVEAGFSNKGGASPIKEEHTTELNGQVEEKPKKSNSKAHKKLLKLKAKKAAAKGEGKQLRVKNSDTSPSLNHTSAGTQSPKSWRASLPLSEQRRQKRIAERAAGTICFMCREKGHAAKDCPTSPTTLDDGDTTGIIGICYRCGSSKHILSRCSKPTDHTNPLPFASCFVCFARGHLAGSCPDNKERGVYPNGGSCKICGDVGHLARECGVRSKAANATLNDPLLYDPSSIIAATGGADEDDFHNFKRRTQQVDRDEKKEDRKKKALGLGVGMRSGFVVDLKGKGVKRKKVVQF